MKPFIAGVLLLLATNRVGFSLIQADRQDVTQVPPATVKEPRRLSDIHPRARPVVLKRAKQCFRLPNGGVCDASQYYELKDTVDKTHKRVITGTETRRGGFKTREKTGERWEIRDTDLADAWEIGLGRGPREEVGPVSRIFDHDYGRSSQSRPLLQCDPANLPRQFFFVDETDRDRFTSGIRNGHYTQITHRLANSVVVVDITALGQQRRDGLHVYLPDTKLAKDDHLPGKYLLWPEPGIVHPSTGKAPASTGKSGTPQNSPTVYRYIPLGNDDVSPDELVQAVDAGRLKLTVWRWDKSPSGIIWTEESVKLDKP